MEGGCLFLVCLSVCRQDWMSGIRVYHIQSSVWESALISTHTHTDADTEEKKRSGTERLIRRKRGEKERSDADCLSKQIVCPSHQSCKQVGKKKKTSTHTHTHTHTHNTHTHTHTHTHTCKQQEKEHHKNQTTQHFEAKKMPQLIHGDPLAG